MAVTFSWSVALAALVVAFCGAGPPNGDEAECSLPVGDARKPGCVTGAGDEAANFDAEARDADVEAEDMKFELLQQRNSMRKRAVPASTGAAAVDTEELERRKVELLTELASIDAELAAEEESGGDGENHDRPLLLEDAANRSEAADNCATYGCGSHSKHHTCQCNKACHRYGNCCHDYYSGCSKCAGLGCNAPYNRDLYCQCNADCSRYHNCCSDYKSVCSSGQESKPTHAPTLPAGSPTPRHDGSLPMGHPSASKSYPQHAGFTLWLVEEFDRPLDLDNDPIWTWSDGGLREGQVRFVKEGVKFENGVMKIEAKQNHGNQEPCSHASVEKIEHKPLTSGELRTKYNLFRYGRYEMRFKAPAVQPGNYNANGNYIATMFTYRDINANHWREIDWEITADHSYSITTNVLNADHTSQWKPEIQKSVHGEYKWVNTRTGFHEYAFEWLPHKIEWFIDGKSVRKHTGVIPDKSTKIMMNLWVFKSPYYFGGTSGSNNRYPMHSEYDWFRFYKWDSDKQYPCMSMDRKCLTDDDMFLTGNNPCDGIPMIGTHPGQCTARCR